MALTKISRGLLDTGVSDSSDATAITIDSSENVGIGETSPLGKIHAKVSDTGASASAQGNLLVLEDTENGLSILSGTSAAGYINFGDSDDNDIGMIIYDHSANAMRFWTNAAERMRIDTSGHVGIGAAPSTTGFGGTFKYLGVQGGSGYGVFNGQTTSTSVNDGAASFFGSTVGTAGFALLGGMQVINVASSSSNAEGGLLFYTGSGGSIPERVRIDNSGNLLVGKTSASLEADGHWFRANGESFHTIANTDNTLHIYDTTNNTYRFYVSGGGTISATSTSITGLSDERLKENIVDLETGISEVMSLKPRRFDWKEGEGSDTKNVAGFVAQEVETVLPDLVGDFKHDDLDDAKSVKMGDMIPTLVKAIQEQQAVIEDLKSRIDQMENK